MISGDTSTAATITRATRPTRPPRARTPTAAATSQIIEIGVIVPWPKPTISTTARHETGSSTRSQRSSSVEKTTRPLRKITPQPIAAVTGLGTIVGQPTTSSAPSSATVILNRAA